MASRNDDSNLLVLTLVLSRLSNTGDQRYTRMLDRFLERQLSQMRDIHTGEKELDILFEELIQSGDFEELVLSRGLRNEKDLYSRRELRQLRNEAQEVAEYTIQNFRSSLEDSVFRRLNDVGSQLASIQQAQTRLESDSASRNEQLELSKAEIQSYLWLLTTGADVSRINMKRYIPVRIYVSDPVPSAEELNYLMIALDELSGLVGFEKTGEFPSEPGSWWKQIFYRTKDAVSQERVQKRMTKVEQAIQTNYLDKPQAEANAHQAEAVSSLVNALKEVPDACIQVGSLLMVKITGADGKPMVLARTLTAQELKLLEENQPMLRCPDRILEWLNHNKDQLALSDGEVQSDSGRTIAPERIRKVDL
jgi:hypothetical protein